MHFDPAGLPPFARGEAGQHGLAERDVRRLLASGELRPLRRGVLVGRRRVELASGDPRARHLLDAAGALCGLGAGAALSHESATWLQNLPRLGPEPDAVRLTRAQGRGGAVPGAWVRRCALPAHHVTEVEGLPVTTVARTVVDLARESSYRAGVVLADGALRAGCPADALAQVLRDCHVWRGIDRAARAVGFADGRAEGPLESVSRVVFAEQGLPAPDLQVPLGGSAPAGRVDFYWREYGVVGEADGLTKYTSVETLRAEKLRQERLEDAGFVVVRWGWADIWNAPGETVGRIRRAFRRAAGAA